MVTKKDLQNAIDEAIADIISAVTKGFETLATKDDLKEVKDGLGERIGKVEMRLEKVELEIKDVKRSINDLRADLPTPQEFQGHDKRIGKLEKAVFSV